MNVCKYCSAIGGYHTQFCPAPHAATEYRIEWCGNVQVYQPITQPTPDVHSLRRELSVASA